jgi:hypothetical protein
MFQYEEAAARRRELFSGEDTRQLAEHYLAANFASLLGGLSLQEVVVMAEGHDVPDLEEFSLVPLVSLSVPEESSLSRPETSFRVPEGIRTTYALR